MSTHTYPDPRAHQQARHSNENANAMEIHRSICRYPVRKQVTKPSQHSDLYIEKKMYSENIYVFTEGLFYTVTK